MKKKKKKKKKKKNGEKAWTRRETASLSNRIDLFARHWKRKMPRENEARFFFFFLSC